MRRAHRSRVPAECSERASARGTRAGTQRKNREARSTRVAPGSRVSLRSPGTRAYEVRRAHKPLAVVSNSRCQTAQCCSFPRRVAAPGLVSIHSRPPRKRGGRSADRRTISVVAFARRDGSARVRRGASHDAGRSPLGAPPWRFSAGGRASISGIASGSVQRCSSQPGPKCLAGGVPGSPSIVR